MTTTAWIAAHGVTITTVPGAPSPHLTPKERAGVAQHLRATVRAATAPGREATFDYPEWRHVAPTTADVIGFVVFCVGKIEGLTGPAQYQDGHSERISRAAATREWALYQSWRTALVAVVGEAAVVELLHCGIVP